MSDETEEQLDAEMQQLMEKEAQEKAAAVQTVPQPEPVPTPVPEAQVPPPVEAPATVTPPAPVTQDADDPLKWAEKKGLTSPEAIARSLQNMEREFHTRNQQGHPGYQDLPNGNPTPPPPTPPPNWQPQPNMYPPPNGYGYPPPPSRQDFTQQLARENNMDPEDVERLMPLIVRVSDAIASRRTSLVERELSEVKRSTARSNELMQLAQDPAFVDARVQKEMHEVLKDGSLFQRERTPYATAFQIALGNLARKQLQQGAIPAPTPSNNPPVTAGGGNGSANTAPFRITEQVFESWPEADQVAYLQSNGRVIPKR